MSKKILIVDDEDLIRNLLAVALTGAGYEVIQIDDGSKCTPMALVKNPSLIIMDINMPGMDGIETIKELKADKRTANIPVLVMTAYATHDNIMNAISAGATSALTKAQVNLNEIFKRIADILKETAEENRINEAIKSAEAQFMEAVKASPDKKSLESTKSSSKDNIAKKPAIPVKIMRQASYDKKIRSITDIKSLPFVAQRVARIASSSGTDTQLLVTELQRDPMLFVKVLRLANSA